MTALPPLRGRSWTHPCAVSILSSLFVVAVFAPAQLRRNLEHLGEPPDWEQLDAYQETISRETFERELLENYSASDETPENFIEIFDDYARILKNTKRPDQIYLLHFADEDAPLSEVPRYWRMPSELPPVTAPDKPLQGLRIAIDPGHIGGTWAKMEERWVRIDETDEPVKEGEIVLRVAELIQASLTKLGARVAIVRRQLEPVTDKRPADFINLAKDYYNLPPDTPADDFTLRNAAERLFYVSSEIRARAEHINQAYKPDLVLALHVNAEAWGDPADPDFVDKNHFHILINGTFSEGEMLKDDQRFEMLERLLQRIHPYELELANTIAETMAAATGLPPYEYVGNNAKRVGPNPYVWSRNLLATRVYECPVIFFEPYVMNHELVYERVQAGEYEGLKEFDGEERPNIFQEYADAAAAGVANFFRNHR